jgi:hypothetical protein
MIFLVALSKLFQRTMAMAPALHFSGAVHALWNNSIQNVISADTQSARCAEKCPFRI